MGADIDLSDLDEFISRITRINTPQMKKKIRAHLNNQGNKLKRHTIKIATERVNSDTGNYLKGIKKGKVYLYQGKAWAVRTYNTQPHAHLIEDGHRIVTKDGREIGFRTGKKVFKSAEESYVDKYISDTDKWVGKILNEGFGI